LFSAVQKKKQDNNVSHSIQKSLKWILQKYLNVIWMCWVYDNLFIGEQMVAKPSKKKLKISRKHRRKINDLLMYYHIIL
jgi:hypothetical protein